MSRIRSVHPGLFTDESFAGLSADAQMFLIGLWTEADDQGVFEWKPMTLRMRLRPTKDGAVEPLLSEIEAAKCIAQFTHGGRQYGAIRNFRKYQRPKKPNAVHPLPDEFRTYVALTATSSEPEAGEPKTIPQKGEIPPQREDEGGKRKEVEEQQVASRAREEIDLEFDETTKFLDKRKPSQATSLPENYPDDEAMHRAIGFWNERHRPDLSHSVRDQAEQFRAHHTAKGTRSKSWAASWRTWIGNALEFNREKANGNDRRSAHDKFLAGGAAFIAKLEDAERESEGDNCDVGATGPRLLPGGLRSGTG